MGSVSNSHDTSLPAGSTRAAGTGTRKSIRLSGVLIFLLGIILLVFSSVLVHFHPRPYPLDLQATETVQGFPSIPVFTGIIILVSSTNDPTPSIIALALWLVGLGAVGLIARARGRSPVRWFQSAVAIVLTVAIAGGLNFMINLLVARPRPGSFGEHIHLFNHIPVKSFPSGHVEHDVAYYGFLLYLSLTPPIRQWRYRWLLLPFQVIAVFDIVTIGYSRILEGEHWLTDVLAGYLSGALWLLLCITLYRLITARIAHRLQARRAPAVKTVAPES